LAQPGSKIRPKVADWSINEGLISVRNKLRFRLETKGSGSYASRHEIYGILAEEMDELLDELRINTRRGYKNFRKELLDVAVAALFGYVCMDENYIPFHSHKHKK
jgi:NTP pyrophosphatase (non-canonical NTP hydrolase)